MNRLTLALLLIVASSRLALSDEMVDLLIVAGQSNAVGYDAHPKELPASEADSKIMFWWRCGDPPPDQHDSTSGGKWTHLQAQPLGDPKKPRADRQYGNFAQPEGGFGPEIGLARTLYAREKKPIAVVKAAFSGTGMRRDWNFADPGENGSCYRALVSETHTAIVAAKKKGITLRPRAFVWVQGESDANAQDSINYSRALGSMLAAFRRDISAPKLISLIAVNTKFSGGKNKFMPVVVRQQQLLAASNPYCAYVDTSHATIANNVHYDAQGTLTVGEAFAEQLIRLEEQLQPKQRHFKIVALGDSITKGVRSGVTSQQTFAAQIEVQLRDLGRSVSLTNVGIGGERTDQALKRLKGVIDLKPNLVTIMYGTNDSYVDKGKTKSRITVDVYRANLIQITARLLEHGIVPILMTEPRWSAKASNNGLGENPNIKLEPYMVACREVAAEWRVPLIDHFATWSKHKEDGTDLHAWTTDGCHPNPSGHKVLASTMLPALKTLTDFQNSTRRKLLNGDAVRVVCFGDSVTGVYYHTGSRQAYTDMLEIALRRVSKNNNVQAINAGISGHTTVNGLKRIDTDVLDKKPDVVTVMFGLNDMTRVPLEDYRTNLKTIVAKCRAIGAEVVLATPNNVSNTSSRPTTKLIKYCDVVREVGKELSVPVADAYREFDGIRTVDYLAWRTLMSDPIHPNMAGHKRIATCLAQAISGYRVSLANVDPFPQPLKRTLERIKGGQAVRVLAMSPFDKQIDTALKQLSPNARVEATPWIVKDKTLREIELDAKSRVRAAKPDLVVIAIPRAATAEETEAFVNSYAWIMNWSLNFGPPTWDVVVIHPSVAVPTIPINNRDNLIRQLVKSQDLTLIDRPVGNTESSEDLLRNWFKTQTSSP
jgi:lysophospholipase L1-like esterase